MFQAGELVGVQAGGQLTRAGPNCATASPKDSDTGPLPLWRTLGQVAPMSSRWVVIWRWPPQKSVLNRDTEIMGGRLSKAARGVIWDSEWQEGPHPGAGQNYGVWVDRVVPSPARPVERPEVIHEPSHTTFQP